MKFLEGFSMKNKLAEVGKKFSKLMIENLYWKTLIVSKNMNC